MADRTASQNGNWNDNATWGGAAFPTIAESVDLATFHVTANVLVACASLVGGVSSELILLRQYFTCAGTMTLDNVAVTTAADMAGVFLGAALVDIGENGSLTLSDDYFINGNLELGGGVLDIGSNDLLVRGDLTYSSGTLSNPGTITQETGNLNWSGFNATFHFAVAPDQTVTLVTAAVSFVKSFTSTSGSTLQPTTTQELEVRSPSVGWWSQAGTVSCDVFIFRGNSAPGGDITLADADLTFQADGVFTVTMDGNIDIGAGTLNIEGALNDHTQTLDMNGFLLTTALVILGRGGNTGDGKLDLGEGTHSIGEIKGNLAANVDNTLTLGTCSITDMTTGIVGLLIDTHTATVAHLHSANGTSTINDMNTTGAVYCHSFDESGSGNLTGNIYFVSGDMPMMGMG